jgi:hypothetical protein
LPGIISGGNGRASRARPLPRLFGQDEIIDRLEVLDGAVSSRRARAIPVWPVPRISVSNWSTTDDVAHSLAALRGAAGPSGDHRG